MPGRSFVIKDADASVQNEENYPVLETIQAASRARFKKVTFDDLVEQAQQTVSKSMDEVSRVMAMIQHFREVAASSHNAETSPASTSIHDSVYQVIRAMQYEFPLRSITVFKILPHDLAPFPMRPEHLEAVLFELVYRAREALLGKPGVITIEVQQQTRKSRENRESGRFVIRVSDNGKPIHPDDLPTIFEPEVDELRIENSQSGMKLALVKKIVDFYQGSVRIETSRRGTAVFVEIPGALNLA